MYVHIRFSSRAKGHFASVDSHMRNTCVYKREIIRRGSLSRLFPHIYICLLLLETLGYVSHVTSLALNARARARTYEGESMWKMRVHRSSVTFARVLSFRFLFAFFRTRSSATTLLASTTLRLIQLCVRARVDIYRCAALGLRFRVYTPYSYISARYLCSTCRFRM